MKRTKTVETECGRLTLSYERIAQSRGGMPVYGVTVTAENAARKKETGVFNDVSFRPEEMDALIDRLYDGAVTPVTLPDVIADFLV